ncbi:unnamed protein product [Rotaria magnacalcarata]|uniref:HAT C-terminal dimerisation domain-containing protein n=2 Tax=Rotaria magnacalcarata TaxID=392030 RepID=A0A817A7R5_9BILA|nr:unnamed protein product [Rotaria magnacalcarata]
MKTTNGSSKFNLCRHLVIRHQINIGTNVSCNMKTKNSSTSHSVINKQRREEIDRLLLNCVIHGALPYNHFNHPWYDALFENLQPGYRAPDRRTLHKRIQSQYREYINELKQLIPKDRPIAFTTDVWKSPTRDHYICLTAHLFDDEIKPVSILLSFRRLIGRKLSKNLNEYIAYELNRFGLKDCFYAGITTDNGSDIKAATELGEFGPRFLCIAHTLNLVVNHALCIWKKPNENGHPFKLYEMNVEVEVEDDLTDDFDDEIINVEQEIYLIDLNGDKQSNETNNLIASSDIDVLPTTATTDVLEDEFISDSEESDDSSVDLPSSMDQENKQLLKLLHKTHALMVRTRKLVKIMRNIGQIDQYVRNHHNGPNNGFVVDIRIRWNSTFYMLKRLIDHQIVVKSIFIHKFSDINADQRRSLANVYLDHENWDILQALHDLLAPLEFATRSLSGKHYATLALAYTTINILRNGLKPKANDSYFLVFLKKSLLSQFDLYFDVKMNKTQKELMLVASYLDPESHQQLCQEDKTAAKVLLPIFMKRELQSSVTSSTPISSISVNTIQTLTDKLKIMVGMSTNVKSLKTLTIEEELILCGRAIQSFTGDFSSFWLQYRERFSRLYRVAQRVNIIPATSVPSESIFSIAGYVARKQRTSLSSTSLRHLMVLKESHRLDALRKISRGSTY